MTPAEVQAVAATEGLSLLRAESATGFKYVAYDERKSKPFRAQLKHDGRLKHLGNFATAHAAASAEGLSLLRAETATGFKGVFYNERKSKPFCAQLRHDGGHKYLGNFATAEEAACQQMNLRT